MYILFKKYVLNCDSFPSFPYFISIFLPPNCTVVFTISSIPEHAEKIPRKRANLGDKLRGISEGGEENLYKLIMVMAQELLYGNKIWKGL